MNQIWGLWAGLLKELVSEYPEVFGLDSMKLRTSYIQISCPLIRYWWQLQSIATVYNGRNCSKDDGTGSNLT